MAAGHGEEQVNGNPLLISDLQKNVHAVCHRMAWQLEYQVLLIDPPEVS